MTILALTGNPRKDAEYKEHFALYGIRASLVTHPAMTEEAIASWLRTQRDKKSFAFREEADIYAPNDKDPVARPYRLAANSALPVINRAKATVYTLDATGRLKRQHLTAEIPGRLVDPAKPKPKNGFDWDDVFSPDTHAFTYHEAKASLGKVSARSLVLDDIITQYLPFRSNRAFKYGRKNQAGLVDLNHWPIEPQTSIQFDTLPIDVLRNNPMLSQPQVARSCVGRMFQAALSEGAHFRAAGNRREWLYWAPGINAGIPLTPKEDPVAELIYLAHDFAHYALPDLIVDTPRDPFLDQVIIAQRMIGETMAMVSADMFVMDALLRSGVEADAGKHGIHPIMASSRLMHLYPEQAFELMLRGAVDCLLLGKTGCLASLMPDNSQAPELLDRFRSKYSNFALADYEWTHRNLQEMHRHQDRQDLWVGMVGKQGFNDLGLQLSSQITARIASKVSSDSDFETILLSVLDDVIEHNLMPKMQVSREVSRPIVLSRTLRRYFTGQLAFYARYPSMIEEGSAFEQMQSAIAQWDLGLPEATTIRALFAGDLEIARSKHLISPIDESVYASVFPIVRPHYVSYAAPAYPTYEKILDLITSE